MRTISSAILAAGGACLTSVQQGGGKFAAWKFSVKESKVLCTDVTVKQTRKKVKGRNCFLATSVLDLNVSFQSFLEIESINFL